MKTLKLVLIGLIAALVLSNCKIMSVYIPVLEPAPITVPSRLKTVAIVNRTIVPDTRQSKALNILEGALTQEIPFQDKIAAEECVLGVVGQLNNLPRFKAVFAEAYKLNGTGTKIFPTPLDWATISDICRKYNCDAVIALEMFDSDNIHAVKPIRKEKVVNGQKQYFTEFDAQLGVKIEAGWRIYDPSTKQIVDENTFIDSRNWNGSGPSESKAIMACPPQIDMVRQGGYFAGQQYAYRISPQWIKVTRDLYKKGNDDIKMAGRMCEAGKWGEAANIYKSYTNDPDHKIAGRACHNLAVMYEVDGDLDAAIIWVQKAYTNYGLKRSRDYYNQLRYRQNAEQRVKEQMKE